LKLVGYLQFFGQFFVVFSKRGSYKTLIDYGLTTFSLYATNYFWKQLW